MKKLLQITFVLAIVATLFTSCEQNSLGEIDVTTFTSSIGQTREALQSKFSYYKIQEDLNSYDQDYFDGVDMYNEEWFVIVNYEDDIATEIIVSSYDASFNKIKVDIKESYSEQSHLLNSDDIQFYEAGDLYLYLYNSSKLVMINIYQNNPF